MGQRRVFVINICLGNEGIKKLGLSHLPKKLWHALNDSSIIWCPKLKVACTATHVKRTTSEAIRTSKVGRNKRVNFSSSYCSMYYLTLWPCFYHSNI